MIAAEDNQVETVKEILDAGRGTCVARFDAYIGAAAISIAPYHRLEMAALLASSCSAFNIGSALVKAVESQQLEMARIFAAKAYARGGNGQCCKEL